MMVTWRRYLFRAELVILLLMVSGFLFSLFAPIWFKPPFFEYTIWLYLIAFFAWVPVFLIFAWRKQSKRFVGAFTVLGVCLTILTFVAILQFYPFNLPTRNISCTEYIVEGDTGYICTLHDEQSLCLNSGTHYAFDAVSGSPIMHFSYAWSGGMCGLF